jgi:hypothetical protein
MLAFGLVMPVAVECFCGGFRVAGIVWPEGWRVIWAVAFELWPVL